MKTNGLCDEVCIFAMCSVPISSIKNADYVVIYSRERLEEPDEAVFIVDLEFAVSA